MTFSKVTVSGRVATVVGRWEVVSLAFGIAPYGVTATLIETENGWKIVSMCAGAG
jgi:hypothetical protein